MEFILGYEYPESTELTEFSSKKLASYNSEEWCVVEADSLDEAKKNYEKTFKQLGQND